MGEGSGQRLGCLAVLLPKLLAAYLKHRCTNVARSNNTACSRRHSTSDLPQWSTAVALRNLWGPSLTIVAKQVAVGRNHIHNGLPFQTPHGVPPAQLVHYRQRHAARRGRAQPWVAAATERWRGAVAQAQTANPASPMVPLRHSHLIVHTGCRAGSPCEPACPSELPQRQHSWAGLAR